MTHANDSHPSTADSSYTEPSRDGSKRKDSKAQKDNDEHNSFEWSRVLYSILFLIILGIVEALTYLTTIVCVVTHFVSGKPLEQAVKFGALLSNYVETIVAFLSYNRDTAPWPFEALNPD